MFSGAIVIVGLVGLLASLVYLLDFARASRRDNLNLPASSGRTRRARRVAGMYTRGGEDTETTFRGGAPALVVPQHDELAAH